MQQQLDPDLMRINTTLTFLKKSKLDFVKPSAISEISDRAEAILVAIDKAANEIDSQSHKYGQKVGIKPGTGGGVKWFEGYEEDQENVDDLVDKAQESEHITKKECIPSALKQLNRLKISLNAKTQLSVASYKIIQSIVYSLRECNTYPTRFLITLLSKVFSNAYFNLQFTMTHLVIMIPCTQFNANNPTTKLLNKIDLQYIQLLQNRLADLTAEFKDNLNDPNYCRRVTSRYIMELYTRLTEIISYIEIGLQQDLYFRPEHVISNMNQYKKVASSTKILLDKCFAKIK